MIDTNAAKVLCHATHCAGAMAMVRIPQRLAALVHFGSLLYSVCGDDLAPAKWGDSDYWLKLHSLEPSSGRMSPPFTPEVGEYEVVVDDPLVNHMTFTLGLDLPKYDLMYPPRIMVDGVEKEYKPIDTIHVNVPLNESIGVEDKLLTIALEDPKGQLDRFAVSRLFGQHSARMVYKLHILQPPSFEKVVRASDIVVKSLTGGLIASEPRFDRHLENVDYTYPLPSGTTSVTFQLVCPKEATGLVYNGVPSTQDQVQTLDIVLPVTTVLAQCVYSDARWTKGQFIQRTYVLTFNLDADVSKTEVDLRMLPNDGSCESETINGQDGFHCRSAHQKCTMVAMYDNPHAQVELKHGSGHQVVLLHGLPQEVLVPKGPATYELMVSAGRSKRSFPVIMARPAGCEDFKCPDGMMPKPKALHSQVVPLCSAAACTPADAPRCCDRGAGWDLKLLEANANKKEMAQAIERQMGTQPAVAEHLVDEVPSVVAEAVSSSEAAELMDALAKLGGIVRKEPTKFASFNLTLERTGPNKTQVEQTLERAAHLSQALALKVVNTTPVQFESGLPIAQARHIKEQIEDQGATVSMHGEPRKYEMSIISIPSGMFSSNLTLDKTGPKKDDVAKHMEKAAHLSQIFASKVVENPPMQFKSGLTNDQAQHIKQQLEVLGAQVSVHKEPPQFELIITDTPSGDLDKLPPTQRNKLVAEVAGIMSLSTEEALKLLKKLPLKVTQGPEDSLKKKQKLLQDSGAGSVVKELHEFSPEQQKKLVDEVARVLNIIPEEALERLKKLPLKVKEGPEDRIRIFEKLLRDLGVGCELKELSGARCDAFKCPRGKILRHEPESITCENNPCRKSDEKVCCGETRFCSKFSCPSRWGHRILPSNAFCAEQDCRDVCCSRLAFCDTFQCPHGYVRHPSAKMISCWEESCQTFGLNLCCNRLPMCKDIDVPHGFVLKPNAANISADPLTVEACAEPQDKCTSLTCPAGSALRHNAKDIFCAGAKCTAKDEQVCCQKAGTCFGFDCPPNFATKPNSWQISCALQECATNDVATCCEPVARCSSLTCPPQQILVKNADKLHCKRHNCTAGDASVCCEDKASCALLRCPKHYGPKQDVDFLRCAGTKCIPADRDVCCDAKLQCRKLPVPDGYRLKDNCFFKWVNEREKDSCFEVLATCDSFGCPLGFMLKPKPEKFRCGEAVCTNADAGVCCDRRKAPAKRLHIMVEDEEGHGKCINIEDGFWCVTLKDNIHLWIVYRLGDKIKKKTPIAPIDVPGESEGVKHVSVVVRDELLVTTMLTIWVGRASGLQERQALSQLAKARAANDAARVPLNESNGNDTTKDQASFAVARQRRLRSGGAQPKEVLV